MTIIETGFFRHPFIWKIADSFSVVGLLCRNSKTQNTWLVCALLIASCMCVFHLPSEDQHTALSVNFETVSVAVECNQDVPDLFQTSAESPLHNQEFVWGWNGTLSFEYWNDTLDQGIENATVQYWWAYDTGYAIEIGNGTYAIQIDTSQVFPGGPYPLTIFASKPGQEPLNELVYIMVNEVPTEIVVSTPIQNQNGGPLDLLVPLGDTINITLFYNDTDSSDNYVGGIPDAESLCEIWGPTLFWSDYLVIELGNGYYNILFDSLDPLLYSTTGGEPVLSSVPYFLNVLLHSQNRSASEISLRISIIEIPTYVEELSYHDPLTLCEGESFVLALQYTDAWHDTPISDASILVSCNNSDVLQIMTILNQSETDSGLYTITVYALSPGPAILSITIEKDFYCSYTESFLVLVVPDPWSPPPPPPIYALPIVVLIIVVLYSYNRKNPNISSETGSLPSPDEQLEVAVTPAHQISTANLETGSFSNIWRLYFMIITILAVLFLSGLI